MIEHLVLFTVRDGISENQEEELVGDLRALKEKVPGVLELTVGRNFSERSGEYTHGLSARFRTRDELQTYIEHPEHRAVVKKLDELTEGRVVVDYEFGD